MQTFEKMLKDYRLTTAEIFYHMPDHPLILQSYIWQELDIAPEFPVLQKFLNFWQRELDGKIHSVRISCNHLVRPAEFRAVGHSIRIH